MSLTATDWHATLEGLAGRNGSVEVTGQPRPGKDQLAPTYRVRILTYNDAGLVIERPSQPEAGAYITRGAALRVLAVQGTERLEFFCTVENLSAFQLNEKTRVMAAHLSPPRDVRSAQRRSFFRVSTAGATLPPVVLTPMPVQPEVVAAAPELAQPQPVAATAGHGGSPQSKQPEPPHFPPQPFSGKLVNIGGGGLGVEAPQRVAKQLPDVLLYRATLELPTLENPIEVGVRLVHLQPLTGGTHYLGLAFEFQDTADRRRAVDQICKFNVWLQRQQLQRLKKEKS